MQHDPLERKVEARLFKGVKALGGRAVKISKVAGYPDRIIMIPRPAARRRRATCRYIWAEIKRLSGKLAEHQEVAHAELEGMFAEVRTLYGYPDVDEFLKEMAAWQTIDNC